MQGVAPHDNFTDLEQYAVCLFEIPASLLSTLIREVLLQEVQQTYSPFLQASRVGVRESTPTAANIPLHALDEDLHDLITRVKDVR